MPSKSPIRHFNPMHDDDLPTRIKVAEVQINRIVSDAESEKGTRVRVNSEIFDQLRAIRDEADRRKESFDLQFLKVNKIIWIAFGAAGLLQAIVTTAIAVWGILKK